ncbi:tail fiber assembly protein [Enterobacter soli]|uniref:tail fiber assembly protein n=1 Tax=Enterobacter soli TaxID=885040 RepID=UPI0034CDEB8C
MIYFSKSINGFFVDGINEDMPEDIVKVSEDIYVSLMSGQQIDGKVITSDENGYPVLVLPEIDNISRAENQRSELLAAADSITADWRIELMLGEISDENKTMLSAWMEYKKELKAVDVTTAPNVNWPTPPSE